MEELRHIIIAAAVFVPVIALAMWLSGWQIGRELTHMLERLYQGDLTATEAFDYVNVQATKLYSPFTVEELRRIARCGIGRRHQLTVKRMHPGQAMVGNYYFHVAWDFEGTDDMGEPFALCREGYLYISCSELRGHMKPCITMVQTRSKPF